jgi:sporulation protein YlmC with PRC-barrel domain
MSCDELGREESQMKKLNHIIWICFIVGALLGMEAMSPCSQASAKERGTYIIIGKTVRNAQGAVIGKVENIVLNDQGCAEYVILSGKFSGARGRYYPMPWTVVRPADDPQYVLIDVDVAVLREAPHISDMRRIDVGQWGPKVHDFYVVRHKVGVQSGVKDQRKKEDRKHDDEDKAKAMRDKKATHEKEDEKAKKEHASPSGKPAMEKQIEKSERKKAHGAKEEVDSVERRIMNKEKNLPLKEDGDTIYREQGKGVQQRLEKAPSSGAGAMEEKKSGMKPDIGSPALPSGLKKGGLPE